MEIFKTISWEEQPSLTLPLTYDQRCKSRVQTILADGQEVVIVADRGERLDKGKLLKSGSGRVLLIVGAMESLLHVIANNSINLSKIAYHLGNRHARIQIDQNWLRITPDLVLSRMIKGLGGETSEVLDVFEPEPGAYSGHPKSSIGAAVIHEFKKCG